MSSCVHSYRLIKQFKSYSEPSLNEDVGYRGIGLVEELQCSRSTPEISIVLAKERDPSPEIDYHTGLPKLPVELLPPSPNLDRKVLPSVLKMSSGCSPTSERKSVTFDPTVLEGEIGGGKESTKVNKVVTLTERVRGFDYGWVLDPRLQFKGEGGLLLR